MNLAILAYFVAIADEMSFSSAAEELFLSQSSLSKQIKRFEQDLGVALFDRDSHQLSLTPVGKLLLPYARRITIELSTIHNELAAYPSQKEMRLRLASFSLLSVYKGDKFIADFILKHNEIDVSMTEMDSRLCLNNLNDGSIDGCMLYDWGAYSPEDYTCIPLSSDRLVAAVGPQNPLAAHTAISLQELRGQKIFMPANYNESSFVDILRHNAPHDDLQIEELGIWLSSMYAYLSRHAGSVTVLPERVAQHYGLPHIPISDAEPFLLSLLFRNDAVLPGFPVLLKEASAFFGDSAIL